MKSYVVSKLRTFLHFRFGASAGRAEGSVQSIQFKSFNVAFMPVFLGAFASAILLYGISFIYGATGSTTYSEISAAFSGNTHAGTNQIVLGMTLAIGAFLIHGLLDSFLAFTPTALLLWMLLGMVLAQKPQVSGR